MTTDQTNPNSEQNLNSSPETEANGTSSTQEETPGSDRPTEGATPNQGSGESPASLEAEPQNTPAPEAEPEEAVGSTEPATGSESATPAASPSTPDASSSSAEAPSPGAATETASESTSEGEKSDSASGATGTVSSPADPAAPSDSTQSSPSTADQSTSSSGSTPATEAAAPASQSGETTSQSDQSTSSSGSTSATQAAAATSESGETTSQGDQAKGEAVEKSGEDATISAAPPAPTTLPGALDPNLTIDELKARWDELEASKKAQDSIELRISSTNRGGVVTNYRGVEVFIPVSHWNLERGNNKVEASEGEEVEAHVLEITAFDTDARRVTATRRRLLRKSLYEDLEPGKVVTGRVSSLTDFGAFVDIGGVDGLLHVSEISHAHVRRPSQVLQKGQEVEVIVKEVDQDRKRISLGRKELIDSPWSGAAERYPADSVQKGKVVSITDIGVFVEVEPGIDGLIRPRELSWTKRIGHPSELFNVGDQIDVAVLNVNEESERMSLSYKKTQENPWPKIVEEFSGDKTFEGTVREISNKGVVLAVNDVEGFLPRGRMGREARKLPEMKAGDKLTVRVIEVDPKRPSLIFGLPMSSGGGGGRGEGRGDGRGEGRGDGRRGGRGGDRDQVHPKVAPKNELKDEGRFTNFSLGDMLADQMKERLGVPEEEKQTKPSAEKPSDSKGSEPSAEKPEETKGTESATSAPGNGADAAATAATSSAESGEPEQDVKEEAAEQLQEVTEQTDAPATNPDAASDPAGEPDSTQPAIEPESPASAEPGDKSQESDDAEAEAEKPDADGESKNDNDSAATKEG